MTLSSSVCTLSQRYRKNQHHLFPPHKGCAGRFKAPGAQKIAGQAGCPLAGKSTMNIISTQIWRVPIQITISI
jgi:hypothetical protein